MGDSEASLRFLTGSALALLSFDKSRDPASYDTAEQTLVADKAASTFLNEPDCALLWLRRGPSGAIAASNTVASSALLVSGSAAAGQMDVFVIKRSPCSAASASPSFQSAVMLISAQGDPLSTLYSALHHVFGPALASALTGAGASPAFAAGVARGSKPVDPALGPALSAVDSALQRTLSFTPNTSASMATAAASAAAIAAAVTAPLPGSAAPPSHVSADVLASLPSLSAEAEFWRHLATSLGGRHAAAVAVYADAVERVARRIDSVVGASHAAVAQLAASTSGAEDERKSADAPAAAAAVTALLPSEQDVLSLVEDAQDMCSDLWLANYPSLPSSSAAATALAPAAARQNAMRRVFSLVANALGTYVRALARAAGPWTTTPFSTLREALGGGAAVLAAWRAAAAAHAARFWTGAAPWADAEPLQLQERLREMLALRTVVDDLLRVLPAQGKPGADGGLAAQLGSGAIFAVFSSVPDALHCAPYAAPAWIAAVAAFTQALAPLETAVAAVLAARLRSLQAHPLMFVHECAATASLLARPAVRTAVRGDRDALLAVLATFLTEREAEFAARANGGAAVAASLPHAAAGAGKRGAYSAASTSAGAGARTVGRVGAVGVGARNLTGAVSALVWASQLLHKTKQVAAITAMFEGEDAAQQSAQGQALVARVRQLLERLSAFQRDVFTAWHSEVLELAQDPSSPLNASAGGAGGAAGVGQIMALDVANGGQLVVFFDDRLVALMREVRQLSELGFGRLLSPVVRSLVDRAQLTYRYSLRVKQAANFFNTFHTEVMPSQLGLLLGEAQAFEDCIRRNAAVRWDRPEDAEGYLDQLTDMMKTLERRNNALRGDHGRLERLLCDLLTLTPARARAAWDDRLRQVAETFTAEEARLGAGKSNPAAMAGWRSHWDHQLFKTVNVQFRLSLASLADHLPAVPCELVLTRHGVVELSPPLPELRARFYRALKQLLDWPLTVPALTPAGAALLRLVAALNADAVVTMYGNATRVLGDLELLRGSHDRWAAVAWLSAEQLADLAAETLTELPHWAANFTSYQRTVREAARVPERQRVGCFTVSLAPFKAALEDSLVRLWTALLVSLKKSLLADCRMLEGFLTEAVAVLSTKPRSMDEMAEAKRRWREISGEKPGKHKLFALMADKDALLCEKIRSGSGGLLGGSGGAADAALSIGVGVADPDALRLKWDEFEALLAGFTQMLEGEREHFKSTVERQISDFGLDLDKFTSRWQALKPVPNDGRGGAVTVEAAREVLTALQAWEDEFKSLDMRATQLIDAAAQFELPSPQAQFARGLVTGSEVAAMRGAWGLYEEYSSALAGMANEKWIEFRPRINTLEDFVKGWQKRLRGRQPDMVQDALVEELKNTLVTFPLLKKVTGESFQREHWRLLFAKLGLPGSVTIETLTLADLMSVADVMRSKSKEISDLAARAQGEVLIREAVDEIKLWMAQAEFATLQHNCTGTGPGAAGVQVTLIKDWKALFGDLSDQSALVGSLKESPYFAPFEDIATQFEARLTLLTEALGDLNQVQRRWVYLEPIFARGALPNEQARFARIDKDFRDIMGAVAADKNIASLAQFPALKQTAEGLLEQLERCQKALNAFLESKRDRFPRFYFLGDDDLLEMLGQADNPSVIDNHVKKLFAGIHSVRFDAGQTKIIAIQSRLKETVVLRRPVPLTVEVESWLAQLTMSMQETLAALLIDCLAAAQQQQPPQVPLGNFTAYPSQVLTLAESVLFARRVESALAAGALPQLQQQLEARLDALTAIDTAGKPVLEYTVKALVLDVIHAIEVVKGLIAQKVSASDNWQWQKEIRAYVLGRDGAVHADIAQLQRSATKPGSGGSSVYDGAQFQCVIKMVNATFAYTFEYQGNEAKLVHTPLTDKCYLVLTQGLHLGYGGSPYGPAGTGKTETVKALGQLLGRQVLVFNCDEGLDFQSMGRIFAGLVKSGAWGCFDEFNRLKEDQLSAVSQQIQVIQSAFKRGESECNLLGKTINVDKNAAIFVTMNPASKEYGGRSKLPHNLKELFRAVAMSVPDNSLIAQVLLYSEGVSSAATLATKLVEVYTLSKQLLSQQIHYDWGLRALKAVLRHCGAVVQKAKAAKRVAGGADALGIAKLSAAEEAGLLVGVLKMNTLSKLTFADATRFSQLLADVFPDVRDEPQSHPELRRAVEATLHDLGLLATPRQLHKIDQLYEAIHQRMGVVLVGPSGSGKSTMLRVLAGALKRLGVGITQYVMNPKAVDRERLLGHMDHDTREWHDGILTNSAKKVMQASESATAAGNSAPAAAAASAQARSWVVCDGDVDPEWVESLNSVLDDNHLLTMPNGARIKFDDSVNFVFETDSLTFASPATVSRMAVIYLSDEDTSSEAVVSAWLASLEPALSAVLAPQMELFHRAVEHVLQLAAAQPGTFVVPTTKLGVITTALSQLPGADTRERFAQGLARGLTSNMPAPTRLAVTRQVFEWAGVRVPAPPGGSSVLDCYLPLPQLSAAGGARAPTAGRAEWQVYAAPGVDALLASGGDGDDDRVSAAGGALSGESPRLVLTPAVQRDIDVLRMWLTPLAHCYFKSSTAVAAAGGGAAGGSGGSMHTHHAQRWEPVVLVGPEGAGKSMLLQQVLGSLRGVTVAALHCSGQTRAVHVVQKLLDVCGVFSSAQGRILRPKDGDRVVLVLKDLNLPKPDAYATMQLVAFLEQLLTHGGFYDDALEWVRVENVQIVGIMNPSSTVGRHPLAPRFTANVRVLNVDAPTPQQLQTVYAAYVHALVHTPGWLPPPGAAAAAPSAATDALEYAVPPAQVPDWHSPAAAQALAQCMVELFTRVSGLFGANEWRHYLRCARHLTAWVLGLLRYPVTPRSLLAAWAYEAQRQFRDHLVDESARLKFDALLAGLIQARFGGAQVNFSAALRTSMVDPLLAAAGAGAVGADSGAGGAAGRDAGPALELVAQADFSEAMASALYAYQRDQQAVSLVLFPEVLGHLAHVEQVLSAPGGSIVLAGDSGVGRRACVALVCQQLGYHLHAPAASARASVKTFRAELKELIRISGAEARGACLLLEDHLVSDERMLEDVNGLLSAGEVPGLFSAPELEGLWAPVREDFKSDPRGCRTVAEFFAARVRRNLHIALCLTPAHPRFRARCEANPALVSKCRTLWLGSWGAGGMRELPAHHLQSVTALIDAEIAAKQQQQQQQQPAAAVAAAVGGAAKRDGEHLLRLVQYVHGSRTGAGASPAKYVAFLQLYAAVFESKRVTLTEKRTRLQAGLTKLTEAASTVNELTQQAQQQQTQVAAKQDEADRALEEITTHMQIVAERQREAAGLKEHLTGEESKIEGKKQIIEAELADIMPILRAAQSAVGTIQKDHLNEIRAYQMPPKAVSHVLGAVLTLMGVQDLTWASMRKTFADPSIKDSIMRFDGAKVTKDVRGKVQKLIQSNLDSFEPARIQSVSKAAAPLAQWVRAQIEYSSVLDTVGPKKAEFEHANAQLESARTRLAQCAEDLARMEGEVKTLKQTFSKTTSEAEALKIGLQKITATVEAAQSLLGKLSGEHERWAQQVRQLSGALVALPYSALLSAGFIAYLGGEDERVRAAMLDDWRGKCGLKKADFLGFISNEAEMLQWKEQGLAADALSLQNAAMILNSHGAVPFVIDPAATAMAWLQRTLTAAAAKQAQAGAQQLQDGQTAATPGGARAPAPPARSEVVVVALQSDRFQTALELAVRFGKTLIVHEVDSIPPMLYPLLRRDVTKQGMRQVVQVGDKIVDYHQDFKLYLFTRDAIQTGSSAAVPAGGDATAAPPSGGGSSQIPVDIVNYLTVVNFTVTRSGLEDQLLALTVNNEFPSLEQRKSSLLAEEEQCKVQLDGLEQQLLEELAKSTGNILENTALIARLDATKSQAVTIASALQRGQALQAQLAAQREAYRSVAALGSVLYFAVAGLRAVNCMYQFSLPSFLALFRATLRQYNRHRGRDPAAAAAAAVTEEESAADALAAVTWLPTALKRTVYAEVSRGLLKADWPVLALLLARAVAPGLCTESEWAVFTGGASAAAAAAAVGVGASEQEQMVEQAVQVPQWVPADRIQPTRALLAALPALAQVLRLHDQQLWAAWASTSHPEEEFPLQLSINGAAGAVSGAAVAPSATAFHRLLLLQAARPDRVVAGVQALAASVLEVPGLAPPQLLLPELTEQAGATQPVLFVTTAGADPSVDIEEFAEKALAAAPAAAGAGDGACRRLVQIALGSGQTTGALEAVLLAARSGGWVLLKNLHLVAAWLPVLEKTVNSLQPHDGFRLFLTTEEHSSFPPLLLQQSLKVAYEAPPGIKQNMLRTLDGWDAQYLAAGSIARAQLLFLLAYFHAVVQERRSYLPQGWTKFYEFSPADARAAADTVDQLFADTARTKQLLAAGAAPDVAVLKALRDLPPAQLEWNVLWGLLRYAVYGGRVDCEQDVRIVATFLRKIFAPDVLSQVDAAPKRRVFPGPELPRSTAKHEFAALIRALPDSDNPAALDLPANVQLEALRAQAGYLTHQLRRIAVVTVAGAEFNKQLWAVRLGPLVHAWKGTLAATVAQVPALASGGSAPIAMPSLRSRPEEWSPIEAFVQLEAAGAAIVVATVHNAVLRLDALLFGSAALTPELQAEGQALMRDAVPGAWFCSQVASTGKWRPETPLTFFRQLLARAGALAGMVSTLQQGSVAALLARPVPLALMFRPSAFLNAMRQETARRTRVPIDGLKAVLTFDPALLPADCPFRATVTGMQAHGAAVAAVNPATNALAAVPAAAASVPQQGGLFGLADPAPSAPSTALLPACILAFVPASQPDIYPTAAAPGVPAVAMVLYTNAEREEQVGQLKVPCATKVPKCILSGAALLLSVE